MANRKPVVLCIMDGWGLSDDSEYNAVKKAHSPVFDRLMTECPHSRLAASEMAVGLPEGQPGNSEVGHMTIGAGRVILQDLPRLSQACASGELAEMPALEKFARQMTQAGGRAHLIGLTSKGGVHSHSDHIRALAIALHAHKVPVTIHILTDGRDTLPKDAKTSLPEFLESLPMGCQIASLTGRYFAMDRDNRRERTNAFLDVLTAGQAEYHAPDALTALEAGYQRGKTDEFIEPACLAGYDGMQKGDGILFANFRVDRVRQIAYGLATPQQAGYELPPSAKITLPFDGPLLSLTPIAADLQKTIPALLPPPDLSQGLGEVVAGHGLKQLRLAETEKYPHVTFFFNGGRDAPFSCEERQLVDSPKVATYDLQPEMSAGDVCDKAETAIRTASHDLIIINFANPDMVGHTGDLAAAIQAVETVDRAVGVLEKAVKQAGGTMLVTADHGNCEVMWDIKAGCAHTAHTTNLVPCILVDGSPMPAEVSLADGSLADLAPTLLDLMNIEKPEVMTGQSLIHPSADSNGDKKA
ncbi:MAG: 2,3-bisphosphoglycerate-independent phosphoglycerate mutase [Alphaproteobacteria bacterium]